MFEKITELYNTFTREVYYYGESPETTTNY